MKKVEFKTIGSEPDVCCIDECKFKGDGRMIGSAACQQCVNCYGWDSEEEWIKCLKYSLEENDKENPNNE